MREKLHDPACHDLARYFLGDLAAGQNPRLVSELAQAIQDCVEDWIEAERDRVAAELQRPPQ